MVDPRKIVLILGNGFDIDFGYDTSYKHYWESPFCPKTYPSPLIRHLNSFKNNLSEIRWCDLENELYVYAIQGDKSDVITEEERRYIMANDDSDLTMKDRFREEDAMLKSLLEKSFAVKEGQVLPAVKVPYREDICQTALYRDKRALQLIEDGLLCYLNSIINSNIKNNSVAKSVLISLLNEYDKGKKVEIYSFNYTPVPQIERDACDIQVQYMHGNCSGKHVIIGIGPDNSINGDYKYLFKYSDPGYRPPKLLESIMDAGEVVIFGHSLGKSDNDYFARYFNGLLSDNTREKSVFLFTRDQESEINLKHSVNEMIKGKYVELVGLNPPTIIKTSNLNGEDGWRFKDFLVRHGVESHDAEVVIGKIVANQAN